MESSWFYFEGGERYGPVSTEELVNVLLRAPEPHRVLLWREGLDDWREAGSFPEIRQALPPPRVVAPPPAPPMPRAPMQAVPMQSIPFGQAENIARYYRRLVLLVGAQLLVAFLQVPLLAASSEAASGLLLALIVVLGLGIAVGLVITAYRLAREMGESVPILWGLAMFIGCINLIVLLILSTKAQNWCRQYGIKVGLLGPSLESIEELRRRAMTSHFE